MSNSLIRISLIASILLSSNARADAFWVLCDHCDRDSSFAEAAVNLAGHNGAVFVSNRLTGTTKKFHRSIQWDRVNGSLRVPVLPKDFSAGEKEVFDAALESGRTYFVALPRNGFAIAEWGIPSVGSVAGDIGNGFLRPFLIDTISSHVPIEGMFPTASGLSHSLGISLKGIFDVSGREVGTSRNSVLNVRITYQDGSTVFITFNPFGEIVSVSAIDAAGKPLALIFSNETGARIDPTTPAEYDFGSSGSADARRLMEFIQRAGTLTCTYSEIADDRVRLTCSRR